MYVPASSVSLYAEAEGWKDFTILPLSGKARSLEVSLPAGSEDGRYKNMVLELVNVETGNKQKYVISDRLTYTFYGLSEMDVFNIYVRNSSGVVLGEIDNIVIADEDLSVTFESLMQLQDVVLSVLTAEGEDVTNQIQATWLDTAGTYLTRGNAIKGMTEGTELTVRIVLPQTLAMAYMVPTDTVYRVQASNNRLRIALKPLPQVAISGMVKDVTTGSTISNAVVTVSQTLNGRYSKAFIAKTDNKGAYSMTVYDAPSAITYSASDYISQTVNYEDFSASFLLGEVALKSITGATITTSFTYRTSVEEGATPDIQNWYSDYANVDYSIYNKTQQKPISDFSVQYPSIVLLEEVAEGDELVLTATSKNGAFVAAKATAVIDASNRAEAMFDIVALGGIKASFTSTDNVAVVGILYNGSGQLVKKYNYSSADINISDLQDGKYTLVSMGSSTLFNSIYNLSQLASTGLKEGTDYVKNTVTVESGLIATISNDLIPTLDESKLYYTGDNTMFSVNKTSVTAGNYLTLKGKIDFKNVYASKVSNVSMVIDLPESAEFVENSVMVGTGISSYMLDGNRLTIPLERYTDQVRFCIIPTTGGDYAPNAFAQFTIDGKEVLQPIGSAHYTIKDLSINVPSTAAKTTIPISGTALGNSTIQIYDNDVLIGETTSLANGVWSTTCELDAPYNLSRHKIYAKVTDKQGLKLQSETRECVYDMNAIEVKTVTMLFYNGWLKKNVEVVFDFENNKTSDTSYMFYTGTDITFVADLTNNDTTLVSDVKIYVFTDKDEVRELPAVYDAKNDKWVAVSRFESNNLPINVSVDFSKQSKILSDREDFDGKYNEIERSRQYYSGILDSINLINNEIKKIEKDIISDSVFFSNISYLIDKNVNDIQQVDSLLLVYLNQISDSVFDTGIFEVTIPELIGKSYVDSILQECDMLLNDENDEEYNSDSIDVLLDNVDLLLEESDFDIESSLSSVLHDTIVFNTDEGEISVYTLPLNLYDSTAFVFGDTIRMPMTDGSTITLFVSDSDDIVIVDSLKSSVWVLDMPQLTSGARSLSVRVASKNFLTAMKDAASEIEDLVESIIKNAIKPWASKAQEELDKLRKSQNDLLSDRAILCGQSAGKHIKIIELEKQIKVLTSKEMISVDEYFDIVDKDEMIKRLEAERSKVLDDIAEIDSKIDKIDVRVNGVKAKIIGVTNVLGTIDNLRQLVNGLKNTLVYINDAISDFNKWHKFIDKIEPCENDASNAAILKSKCESDWGDIAWRKGYYPAFIVSGVATGISGYMMSPAGKGIKVMAQFLIGVITDFLGNTAEKLNTQAKMASKQWYPIRYSEYEALKCNDEDKCPDCGNKPCTCDKYCPKCGKNPCVCKPPIPPLPPVPPIHDPSGYVYEGVSSNRVEGVMASCYYKETVEDMYGDLHENVVLWDAEQYAQENPLFTDEYGMYRWDVPQGLWQVKFEKEGYETAYSDWLPVPPPQLEVNIAMTQSIQPEVKTACAYEEGITIEFDKYMQPTTLNTDNIFVEKNGQKIAGVVMLVNEEQSYEGNAETYASKVRFVPEDAFFATDEVVLTVSRKVESYAGIPMQNDYTQEFDIEKEVKSLVADSIINVPYRRSKQMTISALPYDAAIGKTLVVKSSSSVIATVDADTLVMDENGQATITLTGELPGTSVVTFALADADVNGMSTVQVAIAEEIITANPKASRISGTAVYRGTEVTLSCATEGAVIYYTLDGSCPCDWDTQLIYNAPIVIAEDSIVIKAMAVADGMYESDVVEYRYTLKKTTLGMSLNEGWNWVSHNVETPIAATELETNALRIVGQAAELVNDPAYGFVGNLDSISPTKAYKVQVTEDTKYTLKGYEYDATTPIKLHAGWNWLGYPVSQVMSVNEAFANATPAEGDYIVGQDGFVLYNEGAWIGTLRTLTPGKGYLYQAKNHYEFVYNTAIVSKAKALYSRSRVRKTPWSVNLYRYPNVMCVIADLYEDDVIAEMNRYIVGAFCENECRGIGKLVDGKVMMSIYGNNHEKITFRAMDIETGVTFDVSEELTFAETLHGTMKQSYPLHIMNDDTEISVSTQGWHIYPSVVSTTLYVSAEGNDDIDEITLTDVYGNTVLLLTQMKNPCSINLSHLTEGMYIVTVSEGSVTYNKKILKTTSD